MKNKINNILDKNYLALIVFVAVIYAILGRIGFFLSADSGFAAFIWPPAGAALFFVLIYGSRVWPGIFLGALITSVLNYPHILANPLELLNYPQLITISAGATIQALFAGFLVNKYNCYDPDFSDPEIIGKFYFLVGPVACLTNATIAFLSFIIVGVSSFNSLFEEWLLWWFADSTSTILFFTIIYVFFRFDRKRSKQVAIFLGTGLIVTFGMFFVGRQWEQERMTLLFTQEVISARDTLEQIEGTYRALINNLIGFKSFREDLSKEDFEAFASNNLSFNNTVRSIAWIEKVPNQTKQYFENQLRDEYDEDYKIWFYDDNRNKIDTEIRDIYLPVKYIEPQSQSLAAIGYDVMSDANRSQTLQTAFDLKLPLMTSPVILALEPGEPQAVTIYVPIHRDNEEEGAFAILLKIDSLIGAMINDTSTNELEVSLRDKEAVGSPIFNSERIIDGYIDRDPIVLEVNMFNRTWELMFRRTMNFINKNRTSQPLFIGMAGMVFAALVAIGIVILSGQRLFLEKLVKSRTVDLQKANLTKTEFMANMSHDLRTPLNAIIGFSDIMKKELYGDLGSDKYREYSNDINSSSEYLLSLINDVLDYSAIEANKRNIEKEEIDLKELAEECLRTIRPLSDKKSIVSTLEIPDGTPSLFADVRAIKQIFINLLSNAIKFTPMNGKVSIKIQEKDGNHIIQFIDTGEGIEEKNIARILEPFARVENDPHLPQEGTGLGLSIVQSLVHLHQGTLDIESIVDQGTTITIKIPSV